ncbi:MAG TPA: NUDIX domain-containing protein [Pyrinomonadaceae bacterium]|nr:NUDIX domain-containing protein [Pyrinomonadaceae bacterium]
MVKNPVSTKTLVFGSPKPNVQYVKRRAAYVVITHDGKVAMVKAGEKHFLPGGGSLPGETPEATVVREVHEELALPVRLLRTLGGATQYFYSDADNCHYEMFAVFFAGEFTDRVSTGIGEHQLYWLPAKQTKQACFHECHAWAVCKWILDRTSDSGD